MQRSSIVAILTLGLAYGVFQSCSADSYGSYGDATTAASLTGEALYKDILQKGAAAANRLNDTANAHAGVPQGNSSGFFLTAILRVSNSFAALNNLENGVNANNTGAQCLALNTKIGADIALILANADSAIITTNSPDEQHYQDLLQTWGHYLALFLKIGTEQAATPNPGKYLGLLIKGTADIVAIQDVIARNDTVTCLAVGKELSQDFQKVIGSLNE
ncbi:hypothetical protein BV898_10533 [Hypsibius exemplaris]|uniref:Uncharacterized protein n=1 Tax=Hypsibius exemplaris TaxID=2072580 RepID=A0A1W0WJH0_HYPEX|nr:hypothetical protein BV898_10533 [Hypsibius exemplaris]